MNKSQTAVARWVDHLAQGISVGDWREGKFRGSRRGLAYAGRNIATVHVGSNGPVVRLTMPELGNQRAHLKLRAALELRGVEYYLIPEDVILRARIHEHTIRVLDRKYLLRGGLTPMTLITARTDVRYRYDSAERGRLAYFLAGYDTQEFRRSYFFCELPPGVTPSTVSEAFETLKPSSVWTAEDLGRRVKRQGDIFAVPMPEFQPDSPVAHRSFILGTNHVLDEVVREGGLTYARGKMRHRPVGRRADHRTVNIGKRWHLIVKNTVPLAS